MIHTLSIKDQHLHGSFSNEYQPILTIDSGDSLRLQTPDIQWGYSGTMDEERVVFHSKENEEKPGHPMVGPIEIKKAKPGMVLEVKLNDVVPGWYGRNWAGGNKSWQNDQLGLTGGERIQLDWELNPVTMTGTSQIAGRPFHVALNPFIGLMGVAPAEPGVHSTSPPRYCGGNIDCKELGRGSTLYLPISVEGALFSIGDGHAAQGDGEVSGTAIECPMDLVDITLTVREDMHLKLPTANTPSGWITFGFHEDLNTAAADALNGMVEWIQETHRLGKAEALALASVTVDLRITQVVNGVKGVHAVLPHGAIR
ncbi:acetamidase/formamidase family protein [Bacillus sp. ISL-47]|uniref:acetamidase/formamidase family protein n=1 Tax=Bacillus sp. ISL-47 TaxID=2819130 RepID=UPI001BE6506D|nr:acetamidase/formamidase family protein [Bacillus sp. ISL-47]MBT2690380.1 acetamidase/formamidase family protein [Bacillus sp. ISL-47]MBT2709170.1 acetamidase/formamidase family protein [Pseudomonas sp. ISL-84]